MKHSNQCPKCRSSNIRRFPGEPQCYGIGNNIRSGAFSQVLVTRYLCYTCGYSEEWVEGSDLEKLRKKVP